MRELSRVILAILVLMPLLSFIQGCTTYNINVNKSKKFPPSQEIKIAVLPFSTPASQVLKSTRTVGERTHTIPENAGTCVADAIASALIDAPNIVLIERSQLQKILSEHQLSLTGIINNPDYELLGKILSVDALIIGNVTTFEFFQDRITWGATVAYSARLVNIRSGEMLLMINCNASKFHILPEELANELAKGAIKKLF